MRRYAGTRPLKGNAMDVFDAARRMIDRVETAIENYALARDSELRESLAQADANLAAGKTGSVDDLEAALFPAGDR